MKLDDSRIKSFNALVDLNIVSMFHEVSTAGETPYMPATIRRLPQNIYSASFQSS